MTAKNTQAPIDPGAFLLEHIEAIQFPKKRLASVMGISRPSLYAIFQNRLRITVDIAIKLEALFGRPATEWLAIQNAYDVWMARQQGDLDETLTTLEALREELDVTNTLARHPVLSAS